MNISTLVKELEELKKEYGDIEVAFYDLLRCRYITIDSTLYQDSMFVKGLNRVNETVAKSEPFIGIESDEQ